MSTTILSVMLLIYCQTIDMIFYFHYFGYVGGVGCKVYHVTLWVFFCTIYDKLNILNYKICSEIIYELFFCKNRLKY